MKEAPSLSPSGSGLEIMGRSNGRSECYSSDPGHKLVTGTGQMGRLSGEAGTYGIWMSVIHERIHTLESRGGRVHVPAQLEQDRRLPFTCRSGSSSSSNGGYCSSTPSGRRRAVCVRWYDMEPFGPSWEQQQRAQRPRPTTLVDGSVDTGIRASACVGIAYYWV